MGKYFVGISAVAAWLLYRVGGTGVAFWVAIVVGVANGWSLGILHNFKHDEQVPPFVSHISALNMVTSFLAIVLLLYAVVLNAR